MVAWFQSFGALAVASSLAGAPVAPAAPADPAPQVDPTNSKADAINAAEDAWGRGDFLEVRGLLEPIADTDPLPDRVERERVLVLLADATLSDATLPSDERQVRVTAHLARLMDTNPQWKLPRKVYSPELYDLYLDVRERRLAEAGSQCEADRLACEADADAVGADLKNTQVALDDLQKRYDEQEVAIGVKRTRALAVIPFGISHFLNGDNGLGAAFLATEAALGVTGLTLLIIRATADGCDRTRGFQAGSLVCDPRGDTTEEEVVRRRQAEEAMGWMFIGSIALDILVAQLRFKAFEITETRPRSAIDEKVIDGRERRKRRAKKRRATVRPRAGASREGASLGLEVHF